MHCQIPMCPYLSLRAAAKKWTMPIKNLSQAMPAFSIIFAGRVPTVVVVANDMMALGVMREFRAAGLLVPRDISLVGFDDIAFAALPDPPLITVCSPRLEIGRRAIEALL